MASLDVSKLNYISEINTDQIIYSHSAIESWNASAQTFRYDSGIGTYFLPIVQISTDNQRWFPAGFFDSGGVFAADAYVTDDGFVNIEMTNNAPAMVTTYFRIIGLARPDQPIFQQIKSDNPISYKSEFNYMKIAKSGVIQAGPQGGNETQFTLDIAHNLGYVPFYLIFNRIWIAGSGTFQTTLMETTKSIRGRMSIDKTYFHFNNFLSNPLLTNTATQYYYFIYYD